MMTSTERSQAIGSLIASIPYALIAWGYTKFDASVSFWIALGVLLGVRLMFAIVELLGSVLAWRLHGRTIAVNNALRLFRENQFPPRQYRHDDLSSYLFRIKGDGNIGPELRRTAKEFEAVLEIFDNMGILTGWRMRSAAEAALDIYAPRAYALEGLRT